MNKEVTFIDWGYEKIIAGGKNSRFDFEYISKFNYSCWQKLIEGKNFESILVNNALILELLKAHHKYRETGEIDYGGKETKKFLEKEKDYDFVDGKKEWFVRMSYRSPKDTLESRKPCTNLRQILIAIIKSERCYDDMIAHYYHTVVKKKKLPELFIHLVPWRICKQNDEFRCFVHKKKLVAISYQFPDQFDFAFKGIELALIKKLNEYIVNLWKKYPNLYDSCVIDIEVEKKEKELVPQLVEFNAYHRKGSTSAVLFDWEKDKDLLYNEEGKLELRYSRFSSYNGIPFFLFKNSEDNSITYFQDTK